MPRELIAAGPGNATLREYEDTPPGPSQILIRTEHSSCKHGTEAWVFHGKANWQKARYDSEMGIFFEKRKGPLFPTGLGNMAVGVVEQVGADVATVQPGDRVYFHAGARDSYTIPAERVCTLPDGMTWQEAVCLDPAEFALGAVRDAHVRLGDNVAVFGLGAIGLLAVQMARLQGAGTIVAVDPVEARRAVALETGADLALDPREVDVGLEVRKQVCKTGLDVAIEYSGVTKALGDAIRCLGYGGTLAAGAVYKPPTPELDLGAEFHWNRIKIVSTRACSQPDPDHPRWTNRRIIDTCVELMSLKRLATEPIAQPVVPFAEAADHYNRIEAEPGRYIKLSFEHS